MRTLSPRLSLAEDEILEIIKEEGTADLLAYKNKGCFDEELNISVGGSHVGVSKAALVDTALKTKLVLETFVSQSNLVSCCHFRNAV
jgi:hypothetical protein